jgi:hypothetical protein
VASGLLYCPKTNGLKEERILTPVSPLISTPNEPVKWMGLTITTGVLAAIVLATAGAMMLFPISPAAAISEEAIVAPLEGEVAAAAAPVEGEIAASAPQAESQAAAAPGTAAAGTAASAPVLRRRHHKETLSTDKFAAVEFGTYFPTIRIMKKKKRKKHVLMFFIPSLTILVLSFLFCKIVNSTRSWTMT